MKKLKMLLLSIVICVTTGCVMSEDVAISNEKLPDEVRAQQIKDMKWGMFVCWSFSTFSGKEWTRGVTDVAFFRAKGCDTDQWCQTARDAGMGYILFLAKHHDGFCLWDTKTTDFKVTKSPLGIDVLAKLKKSCDKYGIKLALYFSQGDWNWEGTPIMRRQKEVGKANPEMKKAQIKELLTDYGPIEFFWMDVAQGDGGLNHKETTEWVHKFQPNTFVGFNGADMGAGNRLCARERGGPGPIGSGHAREKSDKNFLVAEFTYPILPKHKGGADWFYSLPKHENLCHSVDKLYNDYVGAVKHGNIFSINVGPDYAGKLRKIDCKTLKATGERIRSAPDDKNSSE